MEKERGIGVFLDQEFSDFLLTGGCSCFGLHSASHLSAGGAEVGDAGTRPALMHFSSQGGIDSGEARSRWLETPAPTKIHFSTQHHPLPIRQTRIIRLTRALAEKNSPGRTADRQPQLWFEIPRHGVDGDPVHLMSDGVVPSRPSEKCIVTTHGRLGHCKSTLTLSWQPGSTWTSRRLCFIPPPLFSHRRRACFSQFVSSREFYVGPGPLPAR